MKQLAKRILLKGVACILNFMTIIMLVIGGSSYLDYAAKHDRFRLASAILYIGFGLILWGAKKLICKKRATLTTEQEHTANQMSF